VRRPQHLAPKGLPLVDERRVTVHRPAEAGPDDERPHRIDKDADARAGEVVELPTKLPVQLPVMTASMDVTIMN
jgi:hypothetical protein